MRQFLIVFLLALTACAAQATTWRTSMLKHTQPEVSGNVFQAPYNAYATNDLFHGQVWVFAFSSTADTLHGRFTVPANYNTTANLVISWTTTVTVNDVEWDFYYRAVGGNDTESFDQATAQESFTSGNNDTAPSAINERMEYTIALTDGNFSPNDEVEWGLIRDQTDAGDSITIYVLVFEVYFEYSD